MRCTDGQNSVRHTDLNVLLVKARKICLYREVIAVVYNIGLHRILAHQIIHLIPLTTKCVIILLRKLPVMSFDALLALDLVLCGLRYQRYHILKRIIPVIKRIHHIVSIRPKHRHQHKSFLLLHQGS